MATNYDYYSQNFRSINKNYYPKKYNNPKENKKYIQPGNVREVEISSLNQTDPSKTKNSTFINENSSEPNLDQVDGISKTNDETSNITYLKQYFNDLEEPHFKDNRRLEEVDIDKKIGDIIILFNQKCEQIKKENNDEMIKIKESMQKSIIEYNKKNEKEIKEIKSLLSWQCFNELRQSLIVSKGEGYSKPKLITSVYSFERYYDSILSNDLKEQFASCSTSTVKDIISSIYETIIDKCPLSLEHKFWSIVKNLKGKSAFKINMSLSGSVYRIVKNFSGEPDEIVIEFGDLQPVLNDHTVKKAKRKISLVINLIYEILIRQIKSSKSPNKVLAYGHIYFGKQDKSIELKEFAESDIYYDYIHL